MKSSTRSTRHATSEPTMAPIVRLLIVADAAAADVEDLPAHVRAVIDAAEEIYVVTPALPGRLAWLASATDGAHHVADERLGVVLGHMRSLHAHATGETSDESASALTAFADAIAGFHPDHILIALRSAEHANWQERGLIGKVMRRFDLPITVFDLDRHGHVPRAADAD